MWEMLYEDVSLSHCVPLSVSIAMLTSFCILQPLWYNDRSSWSQGLVTDAITELHLGRSPVCIPHCRELVSDRSVSV